MKYLLPVCLVALMIGAVRTPEAAAQTLALTKGVNVQMAATNNAVTFPEADDANAWVVAVTADGRLYFGVKPVTPESLLEEMKITPRNREARLYIKADARAPFQSVMQALHAGHEDLFATAVLLTEQPQPPAQSATVPPEGLEVALALPSAKAALVQLHNSGRPTPALKIDDQEISWSGIQDALTQAINRDGKLVVLEADGTLPFAEVVKIIDLSRSAGAKVAVSLMNPQKMNP